MNNLMPIFKNEIKTAETKRLQDRLDTLIRTPHLDRMGERMWDVIEEAHFIEKELSKRNALYPVFRFSTLPKEM